MNSECEGTEIGMRVEETSECGACPERIRRPLDGGTHIGPVDDSHTRRVWRATAFKAPEVTLSVSLAPVKRA